MGLADKLLVLLMVILLPLGMVATYKMFPDDGAEKKKQEELEKRIENVITQLTTAAEKKEPEIPTIKLGQVSYASQSGILKVSGAGQPNAAVIISATVLPSSSPAPVAKGKPTPLPIRGIKVETLSVSTNNKGAFEFEYETGKLMEGVVELRFEQKQSVESVRFDLKSKKQLI